MSFFLHTRPLLASFGPFANTARASFSTQARRSATAPSRILRYTAVGAVGFGACVLLTPRIEFQSRSASPVASRAPTPPPVAREPIPVDDAKPPPAPESVFHPIELSFGLVCGLCTGVFIVKGAKMIAFTLGGVFVLLQYLSINSVVRVDWSRIGGKFEQLFYRTDPLTGKKRPPTVGSLFNWLVNFLTTDFQPRASFLAGMVLGIRLG